MMICGGLCAFALVFQWGKGGQITLDVGGWHDIEYPDTEQYTHRVGELPIQTWGVYGEIRSVEPPV
jgi:hypothetical protein